MTLVARQAVRAEFEHLKVQELERLDRPIVLSFNPRLRSAIGRTDWKDGYVVIEMGEWAMDRLRVDELVDTVRHEFAHVLAGEEAGHGPAWKAHAIRLGTTPKAKKKVSACPQRPPKWSLVCERCGIQVGVRHRRDKTTTYRHKQCGGRVVWLERSRCSA